MIPLTCGHRKLIKCSSKWKHHLSVIPVPFPNISLTSCLASWWRDTPVQHIHTTVSDRFYLLICINRLMSTHSHAGTGVTPWRPPEKKKELCCCRTNHYWKPLRFYFLLYIFAQQHSIDFCPAFQNIPKIAEVESSWDTCCYIEMWTHRNFIDEDWKKTWDFLQNSNSSVFILNESFKMSTLFLWMHIHAYIYKYSCCRLWI